MIWAPTDSVSLGKSFYFSGSISLSLKELVKHFKIIQHCREPSVSTVLFGSSYRLGGRLRKWGFGCPLLNQSSAIGTHMLSCSKVLTQWNAIHSGQFVWGADREYISHLFLTSLEDFHLALYAGFCIRFYFRRGITALCVFPRIFNITSKVVEEYKFSPKLYDKWGVGMLMPGLWAVPPEAQIPRHGKEQGVPVLFVWWSPWIQMDFIIKNPSLKILVLFVL